MKTVLSGEEWKSYLVKKGMANKSYMETYHSTYNYKQIFKVGDYFFCMSIKKGYLNISSLKKQMAVN